MRCLLSCQPASLPVRLADLGPSLSWGLTDDCLPVYWGGALPVLTFTLIYDFRIAVCLPRALL